MNSAVLNFVENLATKVRDGKLATGDGGALLQRLLHGPALAFAVKLTPNPVDDIVLELFKSLIPAK